MSDAESIRIRLKPGQRAELARLAAEAGFPDTSSWMLSLTGIERAPARKGPPRSEEAIARETRIRELAAIGMKASQIAVEVGRSAGWVRRVLASEDPG